MVQVVESTGACHRAALAYLTAKRTTEPSDEAIPLAVPNGVVMPLSGLTTTAFRALEQAGDDCKALGKCWQTYWTMEPTLIERSTGSSATGAPMTECANSKNAATEARRTIGDDR